MNSRQRIDTAVRFDELDCVPYDFFDEAGFLFTEGRYNPALRLRLTYREQVEARIRFHQEYKTDLIFDVPVFIPSRIPHRVRLFYGAKELFFDGPLFSSISGMAWNAMPPKVIGQDLLHETATGMVVREVTWENGKRALEALDLATGTTDLSECGFQDAGDLLPNADCMAGDISHADFSWISYIRESVGPDIVLSGTICEPFSTLAWCVGIEKIMYVASEEPDLLSNLLTVFEQFAIEAGVAMAQHGLDMIRIGAATSCLLSPSLYEMYCLPYQQRLITAIQETGAYAQLHLCGRIGHLLDLLPRTEAAILETITPPPLGDTTLEQAKQTVGRTMCLKGNMNPLGMLQSGTPGQAVEEARHCLTVGQQKGGFIWSVADNLAPGTPEANLRTVAEFLQNQP